MLLDRHGIAGVVASSLKRSKVSHRLFQVPAGESPAVLAMDRRHQNLAALSGARAVRATIPAALQVRFEGVAGEFAPVCGRIHQP
jgi:hypothetical protein